MKQAELLISEDEKQAFLMAHAGEYFWCDKEHALLSMKQCEINQAVSKLRVKVEPHRSDLSLYACARSGCWNCRFAKANQVDRL